MLDYQNSQTVPTNQLNTGTNGAFDVVITNLHASAAFDAAMIINFIVLKNNIV